MSDFRPLGKALPREEPKKPDVIEKVSADTYKVNGRFVSRDFKEDIYRKAIEDAPMIYTPSQWDAVIKQMQVQQDDGFPLNEWGVL